MSENQVKRCPKCGGIMMPGILSTKKKQRSETDFGRRLVRLFVGGWALRKGDFQGDKIIPFCCKSCGYVELYKEMKEEKG
jgi:predicted nucleic-acid-binding Zn-ribbon protein